MRGTAFNLLLAFVAPQATASPIPIDVESIEQSWVSDCLKGDNATKIKCTEQTFGENFTKITAEKNNSRVKFRTVYPNNQVHATFETDSGAFDGEFLSYHLNGKVKEKGKFSNGKLTETLFYFDDLGTLTSRIDFHSPTTPSTPLNYTHTSYHFNGSKSKVTKVKGGKIQKATSYDLNGKMISTFYSDSKNEFIKSSMVGDSKFVSIFKNGEFNKAAAELSGGYHLQINRTEYGRSSHLYNKNRKLVAMGGLIEGEYTGQLFITPIGLLSFISKADGDEIAILEVGKKSFDDESYTEKLTLIRQNDGQTLFQFESYPGDPAKFIPIDLESDSHLYSLISDSYNDVEHLDITLTEFTSPEVTDHWFRTVVSHQTNEYLRELNKKCKNLGFVKLCE